MAYLLRYRCLPAAAVLGLLLTPALAQQKFGFVNSPVILRDTQEGKAKLATLDQWVEQRRKEIEAEGQQLQQLQQQFTEQQASLNAETRADMQRTIEEKATNLRRKQEDSEREAERRSDTVLQEMGQKIRTVLREYGEQNGYTAIFLRHPEQQVFVAAALDLTAEIVKRYDEKHPVAAGGSN